ncbi:MAG: TrkA family potassium uptake protein [Candidatus Omnitrophica bacterium]|nr:TrkA family potassium uptake protein [Candidatus Omnitrophota bacterium]
MRQIAVIGLGKFGGTVAKELTARGAQVIAIDEQKERVESLKESVTYAVAVNSTDENALRAIGIQNVDIAVICIGEDIEAALLTTLLLKKMGIKRIWTRAISPLQQEIFKTLQVDYIINLEEEMGKIIANSLTSSNVTRHIPLTSGCSIAEIKMHKSFVGKSLREINTRKRFNINIVAVKKKRPKINDLGERIFEEYVENVPSPDTPLEEDNVLLVVGTDKDIEKFAKAA